MKIDSQEWWMIAVNSAKHYYDQVGNKKSKELGQNTTERKWQGY
jgi:hypothetical protein